MPIEFGDFPAMFDNPLNLQTPDSGFPARDLLTKDRCFLASSLHVAKLNLSVSGWL